MGNANPQKQRKRNMLGSFIVAAIAYIVLGVFMVMHPQETENGIHIVFGVIMLIYGAVNIVSFFLNKDSEENLFFELCFGVIAAAVGLFALIAPQIIRDILFYAIGVIVVIDGAINVKRAFNLKAYGMRYWYVMLIISCVAIVAGIAAVVLRNFVIDFIVVMLGISLIYEGVSSIVTMIMVGHYKKKITKELALTEQNS